MFKVLLVMASAGIAALVIFDKNAKLNARWDEMRAVEQDRVDSLSDWCAESTRERASARGFGKMVIGRMLSFVGVPTQLGSTFVDITTPPGDANCGIVYYSEGN